MLCAHIVNTLRSDKAKSTLYYFAGSPVNTCSDASRILRSLIVQLIRHDPTLAIHISIQYTRQGLSASLAQLRKILSKVLIAVPPAQVLIDGLDECDGDSHLSILSELFSLSSPSAQLAKVLICSREGGVVSQKLCRKPTISLREESTSMEKDLRTFVQARLEDVRFHWDFEVGRGTLAEVEQKLTQQANGKCKLRTKDQA